MTHTSATTTNESDLLTITDAATLLRTPVATLRYWRHEVLEWLHQQTDGGR
jgi:hypothetical protein